eukprot:11955-Heterococcus_DN1.PRE.2
MMPPLLLRLLAHVRNASKQQQCARVLAVAHAVYGQVYRRATAVETAVRCIAQPLTAATVLTHKRVLCRNVRSSNVSSSNHKAACTEG